MSKEVTFHQIEKTLSKYGFTVRNSKGSHSVFTHSKNGVVVTVPNASGKVRPVFVKNIVRQISNSGIAAADNFERELIGHTK